MIEFQQWLSNFSSTLPVEALFYYALIAAGAIALVIRQLMVVFIRRKARIRTGRATGRIDSFERSVGLDGPDSFFPIVEFKALDKTFRVRTSIGQYDQKIPKYAPDGNVIIRFNPADPSDADLDSLELVKWQTLYVSLLLYVGIGLIIFGGLMLKSRW